MNLKDEGETSGGIVGQFSIKPRTLRELGGVGNVACVHCILLLGTQTERARPCAARVARERRCAICRGRLYVVPLRRCT